MNNYFFIFFLKVAVYLTNRILLNTDFKIFIIKTIFFKKNNHKKRNTIFIL